MHGSLALLLRSSTDREEPPAQPVEIGATTRLLRDCGELADLLRRSGTETDLKGIDTGDKADV